MDWSLSKVIRIEAGNVGIQTNDLKALLRYYQVDPERTDEFVVLARAARERAWWSGYRDVASPWLLQLIGYESAAFIKRNFETLLVPGILQTEEYARAVIEQWEEGAPAGRVDSLVEKFQMLNERLGINHILVGEDYREFAPLVERLRGSS